ncbi:MAG: hypothetical protein ACOYBL_07360 [Lachnospiraceae bacterium]|jgi:hypothetical protein
MKKKGGWERSLLNWSYENQKQGTKAAQMLKSVTEMEKTLREIEIKKKK